MVRLTYEVGIKIAKKSVREYFISDYVNKFSVESKNK